MRKQETGQFKKEMGLFSGISLIAGIMIGSGIFYIGGIVLERTQFSLSTSILVWTIGGVLTLLCGLCYAELGASMPKSGGGYLYLKEAFGEKVAFLSGWSSFLVSASGSNAALAIALVSLLSTIIPISGIGVKLLAALTIIGLSIVNILGVKIGSFIQNLLMVAKLIPIILIIILGFSMGDIPLSETMISSKTTFEGGLFTIVAFAIIASLWAYEGWTNLNTVVEEMKDVKRNLPLALIGAISLVTLVYVLFHLAIFRIVPLSQLQTAIEGGDYYIGIQAAVSLFGAAGGMVVTIGAFISIFGSLNGCILAFPRAYYAMAKDDLFFKGFGELHPKYGTPVKSIIGSCVISVLLVFSGNLSQITSMVVFSGWVFTLLTICSIFIFRRKYPTLERPYKVWGYPIVPILAVLVTLFILVNSFLEDPRSALIGCLVPLTGVPIYFAFKWFNQRKSVGMTRDLALEGE